MKVLFLGQRPLGMACFQVLLGNPSRFPDVEIVIAVGDEPIYTAALEAGISRFYNTSKHEQTILNEIEERKPDILMSVKHPWVFSEKIIDAMKGEAYNIHCAKLPEYQGWNACTNAILNSEKEFVVTLHRIAPVVDTGNMIYTSTFPIEPGDTAGSLDEKSVIAGLAIFEQFIHDKANGKTLQEYPLKGEPHFYHKDMDREIKLVSAVTDRIARVARAFTHPEHSPAYIMHKGIKYEIRAVG